MTYYYWTENEEQYLVALWPLTEYEKDGGEYDDSANGGEVFAEDERAFLAAISVTDEDGRDVTLELVDRAVTTRDAIWHDGISGWTLIRAWPPAAPLAARCF